MLHDSGTYTTAPLRVPFEVGIDLAHRNHVAEILVPIFQLQAQAAGMSSLPPGVLNAPASASKRRLAGGKGKATASDAASVGSGRAGTAESSRISVSNVNSPFTTMPFQPAPTSVSKVKPNLDTSMRPVQALPPGSQPHHLSQSQHMQSPGNVFVVQTPQALQGRTLQPTATGLMPGYGHAHMPQLYQGQGQPSIQQQQAQQQAGMQSPMGLYTHRQSQYPHYQQAQPHQTLVIPPPSGHLQNGQTVTLKRPYPDDSDSISGHPNVNARPNVELKPGTVYLDQYGRPFRYQAESDDANSAEFVTYTTEQGHSDGPPTKRIKIEGLQVQDMMTEMADEPAPMTLAEVSALLSHDNEQGPMESLAEIADADVENGEDYEIENGEVQGDLPPGTRLASKPQRPSTTRDTTGSTPLKEKNQSISRARAKLLAIFEASGDNDVDLDSLLVQSPTSSPTRANGDTSLESITAREIDIDQVIDERGHTALHWAASLARERLVAQLISRGADVNRGNFAGETPLMRSILATNNAENAASFQTLLSHHLGQSLRTVDNSHRTVLHHIAAVAGIKGRSASANTYLSTLLAWMATIETPDQIREFVNIQDVNGDTALNVAARVGNRNIVKLLLDAGADKTKANKLGLRPGDFGVQVEVSSLATLSLQQLNPSLIGPRWLPTARSSSEVVS